MAAEKRILAVASICLCALLLTTSERIMAGDPGTPAERPFRIQGEARVHIDWESQNLDPDGRPFVPWTMTASQLSTEGWSTNEAEGKLFLDTFVSEGIGVGTELNGDTIEWSASEEYGTQHVTVTFTGGTGQYEGASGGFSFDYTVIDAEVNEDGNPVRMTYSFWGTGSITN